MLIMSTTLPSSGNFKNSAILEQVDSLCSNPSSKTIRTIRRWLAGRHISVRPNLSCRLNRRVCVDQQDRTDSCPFVTQEGEQSRVVRIECEPENEQFSRF